MILKKTLGVCPVKLEKYLNKICVFKKKKTINKFTGKELRALVITFMVSCKNFQIKKICKS